MATAQTAGLASSGPGATLAASFQPERLGAPTSVAFALTLDPPPETAPTPVMQIDLSYPGDLGFATSGLGLAACDPAALEARGASACPANSRMGGGSASVAVPFGTEVVAERVALEMFAAPSPDGFLHLAILARGSEPVQARIVISAVLLVGHLQITVPTVPALPGGPDVALTEIRGRLGGPLTYYEDVRGHRVAYHPKGIGLPDRCPSGGWHLGAGIAFENGQHSQARAVVACPHAALGKRR